MKILLLTNHVLVTTQVKQNAEAILDSKSVKNDFVALGNVITLKYFHYYL
jgi:hypothetical protein